MQRTRTMHMHVYMCCHLALHRLSCGPGFLYALAGGLCCIMQTCLAVAPSCCFSACNEQVNLMMRMAGTPYTCASIYCTLW